MVRTDDEVAHSLDDLAGKSWLYNEKGSLSGYRIFTAELAARGRRSDFIAAATPTGSHQASLERLVNGEGDYTTLDSTFVDFLPQATRERIRIVESLGPHPLPLLVANHTGEEFWRACQKLDRLPAPLTRLHRVSAHDYKPIADLWNTSLEFETEKPQGQVFIHTSEGDPVRTFTTPEVCRRDRDILNLVASELPTFRDHEPTRQLPNGQTFHLTHQNGLARHVYLVHPDDLEQCHLTVVGFLSQMKPDASLVDLFEADDRLISQFHLHEGFVSYSPTEYEPGRWANLVVFRTLKGREDWAANDIHLRAVRALSANSYQNIRLHLGSWPALNQPIEWIATRYLSYEDQGLWRGVRLSDLSLV